MNDEQRQLDLSSEPVGTPPAASQGEGTGFLGVHFTCCGLYARVYRNRNGDAYEGRCPRCMGSIRIGIGSGGTSGRFFSAG